jgi:hypothetical protein
MGHCELPEEKLPLLIASRIHELEDDGVLKVGKCCLLIRTSIGAKAKEWEGRLAVRCSSDTEEREDGTRQKRKFVIPGKWRDDTVSTDECDSEVATD